MKRISASLLLAVFTMLAVLLSSCGTAPAAAPASGSTAPAAAAPTSAAAAPANEFSVGISMPTKSSARWIADGANMVKYFNDAGYKTDLQYAEDDIPNQVA